MLPKFRTQLTLHLGITHNMQAAFHKESIGKECLSLIILPQTGPGLLYTPRKNRIYKTASSNSMESVTLSSFVRSVPRHQILSLSLARKNLKSRLQVYAGSTFEPAHQ